MAVNLKEWRDSVVHEKDLVGKETTLFIALYDLVDELDKWDVPQTDNNGNFSVDTCLGHAMWVLANIGAKK